MNTCELVYLATTISCAIAQCVPESELPVIAAVFGQIAATLATITVNEEANKPKKGMLDVAPDSELITEPINPVR